MEAMRGKHSISSNPSSLSTHSSVRRGCPSLISEGKGKPLPSSKHHSPRVLEERTALALLGPSQVRTSTSHCRIL